MDTAGPISVFSYARRSTTIRPQIQVRETVPATAPGDYRSLPRGVDCPAGSRAVKPSKPEEKPTEIGVSGISSGPSMEPESPSTLEPRSHL
jgi:hypothetical protein